MLDIHYGILEFKMLKNHRHIQIVPYFPYPSFCCVQDVLISPLGTAALNLNYHNEVYTILFFWNRLLRQSVFLMNLKFMEELSLKVLGLVK